MRALLACKFERRFHLIQHLLQFGGGKGANHSIAVVTFDVALVSANDAIQEACTFRVADITMAHGPQWPPVAVSYVSHYSTNEASRHPGPGPNANATAVADNSEIIGDWKKSPFPVGVCILAPVFVAAKVQ
jgi:hypothetical protein